MLTKAGTNYIYTQSGDNVLKYITLDGVSADFPRSCAAATITAGDATFSITANGDFTVDDTGSVPVLGKGGAIVDGQIFFDGREITNLSDGQRRRLSGDSIGFIFQNAGASFCPIRTIGDQIFESVRAHRDWSREDFRSRAEAVMEKINLKPSTLDEYPFRLSGGMAQRAGILAATLLEPKLLLADEPTSALDVVTQMGVVEELLNLRGRLGASIVLVTHDLRIARRMADKILIMRQGTAVEFGTREQIFNEPQEAYTQELIEAAGL